MYSKSRWLLNITLVIIASFAVSVGGSVASMNVASATPGVPASGQDVNQTFRNQATDRCITEAGGLRTATCSVLDVFQVWTVHVWADNTRQLKNTITGRCMDDSDVGFRTLDCWAGSDPRSRHQSWFVHRWNDGTIQLKNQATGRCIDDSDLGLRTLDPCWAGSDPRSRHQSWF